VVYTEDGQLPAQDYAKASGTTALAERWRAVLFVERVTDISRPGRAPRDGR
jgi:hypothetical protein